MKHFLTVIVPDKKAVKYALKGNIISIGRGKENAIVLDVSAVSSTHLEIHKTHSGYRVIDLDSTNGTTVNGTRISDHQLANGDELIIGTAIRAKYAAVADESTAATAPAAAIPPRTVANPAQPDSPTVILKRAPAPAALAPSQPITPPSEIRSPRKLRPPGAADPAEESKPAQAQPEPETSPEPQAQSGAPKLNVPNRGQSGGPRKLNLG